MVALMLSVKPPPYESAEVSVCYTVISLTPQKAIDVQCVNQLFTFWNGFELLMLVTCEWVVIAIYSIPEFGRNEPDACVKIMAHLREDMRRHTRRS